MPKVSKKRRPLYLGSLLLLVAMIGFGWAWRSPAEFVSPPTTLVKPAAAALPASAEAAGITEPARNPMKEKARATPAPPAPDPALLARFAGFRKRLASGLSREETVAALNELKQLVHDLPPEIAAATLIALLQSGDDTSTGLAFAVGAEGVLAESPTYRVALLDLLGQTDPDAAASFSRSLLASTTASSDEYALGLRNLAWLNHDGDLTPIISGYFSAMLDKADWRAQPSDGYLEAFDVAVEIGGSSMVAELASVLRLTTSDGEVIESAVNRAAFIALDRIMLREPETIVGIYLADPTFLDFAPNHRASVLARLDASAPTQAQALRSYLLSTPAESPELAYFARVFPNGNFFEANRLISSWETTSTTLSSAERDKTALVFVDTLLDDATYAPVAAPLQEIRARLQSFTTEPPPAPATPPNPPNPPDTPTRPEKA